MQFRLSIILLQEKKGYRIYLDSEKTTISDNCKKRDGRIEKIPMDIKTINDTGPHTIKGAMEKAAKQGAKAVILFQKHIKDDIHMIGIAAVVITYRC